MPVDEHVDECPVEDLLGIGQSRVDLLHEEHARPLDLAPQPLEQVVLLEPDADLVARVGGDIREEYARDASGTPGIADGGHPQAFPTPFQQRIQHQM